jgi:chaperone BCS1
MDIIKLNFTDVDNETFADIYSDLDENSLFVLEDFDCSNSSNRTDLGTPSSGSKNLTFDCILNHLDGPNSKEGVITFITTNIIKDLDPALIRPGRIDKIYEIPRATRIQKKEMFLSFYPDSNLSDSFASLVEDMSMSSLQEIFIVNKGNTDKDVIDSLINKKSESEALRGTVV